jgi:hypothetical protein
LGKALKVLGYKVTGPNGVNDAEIDKKARELVFDLAKKYDAFQDNPWPLFYKELDREFPGSKFVLTVRDEVSWIKSQVSHFGYAETPMRRGSLPRQVSFSQRRGAGVFRGAGERFSCHGFSCWRRLGKTMQFFGERYPKRTFPTC